MAKVKNRINLEDYYGENLSTIEFIPYCEDKIEVPESIYIDLNEERIILICIGENQFQLRTDNPKSKVKGEILLSSTWVKYK